MRLILAGSCQSDNPGVAGVRLFVLSLIAPRRGGVQEVKSRKSNAGGTTLAEFVRHDLTEAGFDLPKRWRHAQVRFVRV